MKIPQFRAPKDFKVKHTHASVVLGIYPLPAKFSKAIELGCGNAVSSLLMILLNPSIKKIVAIDVDKKACESARNFVRLNNLSDKIEVMEANISKLEKRVGYESFDFVFFNPPFHVGGKVSKDERRFLERNQDVFETFSTTCASVLKNGGYFRIIISPQNLLKNISTLLEHKLTPKWIVPIYGKFGVDSKLVLIEGIKNGKMGGFKIKPPIILDDLN